MRKLVLILLAFIAVITFIRAYDNTGYMNRDKASEISSSINDLESNR